MATSAVLSAHLEAPELFNGEGIFDLHSEYTALSLTLARMTEERESLFALSIDPQTPRFFLGDPEPFRELLIALVDKCLANAGVDIVNVRIDSIGILANGRHHLELTVTANGYSPPPRQPDLFGPMPKPPKAPSCCTGRDDHHAMLMLNTLANRLNGTLRIDNVYCWGSRYVIRFQLSRLAKTSPDNILKQFT